MGCGSAEGQARIRVISHGSGMSRKAQYKKQQDGEQEKPSFHKITSSRIIVQVLTPYYINAEEGGFLTRFLAIIFAFLFECLQPVEPCPAHPDPQRL